MHVSSTVIVSTKAASTGRMSSIFNIAYGVKSLFEKGLNLKQPSIKNRLLTFAVRRPHSSIGSQSDINTEIVNIQKKLITESLMPSNVIVYGTGIESDYLQFSSRSKADTTLSNNTCDLVIKMDWLLFETIQLKTYENFISSVFS